MGMDLALKAKLQKQQSANIDKYTHFQGTIMRLREELESKQRGAKNYAK